MSESGRPGRIVLFLAGAVLLALFAVRIWYTFFLD